MLERADVDPEPELLLVIEPTGRIYSGRRSGEYDCSLVRSITAALTSERLHSTFQGRACIMLIGIDNDSEAA